MEHRDIIEGLLSPEAFPFETYGIELVQTRLSSVLLAGEFAYKLKKPVRTDFLDFSTLEKRRYFCEQEVVLNRRLAPDVYLDVVPVVAGGGVRVEGGGEPVEYAVKMKRLPAEKMMNVLLEGDRLDPVWIDEIAAVVARFHDETRTDPRISEFGTPGALERELGKDLRQIGIYSGVTIPGTALADINSYFERWLEENAALLAERASGGHIRDCHGDMHSRNICLPDEVCIFDCIEFNEEFRFIDTAREVAFLAMDLDFYDQPGLSQRYVHRYVELSGDEGLVGVLDFYKTWLSIVRGKVHSMPIDDADVSPQERKYSVFKARRYFELAHRYAGGTEPPVLLALMGVMGTGKSVLAGELASRMHLQVLDSDIVRKNLAGIPAEESRKVGFGEDIYSPEMTEQVYGALAHYAAAMTDSGYSVLLDASFAKRRHREMILELAMGSDTRLLFVECTAPLEVLRERLLARERRGGEVSDGRLELLPRQIEGFEPTSELPERLLLKLDTKAPPSALADEVEERVDLVYGKLSPDFG